MSWVFVTEQKLAAGMLAAVRALTEPVTAVVVGSQELAGAVAALGPDEVRWVEPAAGVPVEAYAQGLAEAAVEAAPRMLVSSSEPAARALLGAAAARLGAVVIPGLLDVVAPLAPLGDRAGELGDRAGELGDRAGELGDRAGVLGDRAGVLRDRAGVLGDRAGVLVVRRSAIGGEVVETLATSQPVAGIFAGEDVEAESGADQQAGTASPPTPEPLAAPAADLRITGTEAAAAATGLSDAARVVGFGRGVRAKEDVALIERLATALDAEVGCTMPVADDLRWLEKARYLGRSGQHIAPRLYLAIGIGGAPQHMEGVRDARVVAAINNDPEARVFRAADYGVVGDLYEVVPALIEAVRNEGGGA